MISSKMDNLGKSFIIPVKICSSGTSSWEPKLVPTTEESRDSVRFLLVIFDVLYVRVC